MVEGVDDVVLFFGVDFGGAFLGFGGAFCFGCAFDFGAGFFVTFAFGDRDKGSSSESSDDESLSVQDICFFLIERKIEKRNRAVKLENQENRCTWCTILIPGTTGTGTR